MYSSVKVKTLGSVLRMALFVFFLLAIKYSSGQCVNPAWDAGKHWSTYVVGEIYSEGGKDWVVHDINWAQSYSPSSADGNLGFSLHAESCDLGASAPSLTFSGSANVTCTAADLTGNISDDGGSDVTTRGFIYGTDEDDVNNSTASSLQGSTTLLNETGTFSDGDYTLSLSSLTSNLRYYVRAYAINASGTTETDEDASSFYTCASEPTLTTKIKSALSCETVKSGGSISSDGGDAVTARGVCWSTTANPTIADSKTEDGGGVGGFNSAVSGLTAGETYFIRAYATNGIGTAYGSESSFTTKTGCSPVYYSCATSNTWSLNMDCSSDDGTPGNSDIAELRHDWFDDLYSYSLAHLAYGQSGADWFDAKPLKLKIKSGGRAVFNTTSYSGLPADFSLEVEESGVFASYTSLEVINSFENHGAVHLFGAVTNGNNITGTGTICYDGNFENSTLSGSINGSFLSANQVTLDDEFFTSTDADIGGSCGSMSGVLPIELLSFEAVKNGNKVDVVWTTVSEINCDYYEVESSRDGMNWISFAYENGAGNSDVLNSYQAQDFDVNLANRKYYRLKQVDFDGTSRYSQIKVVNLQEEGGIVRVYDNGTDVVVELFFQNSENISVSLLNMSGVEVANVSTREISGKQTQNIKISKSNLSTGLYVVLVNGMSYPVSEKVMVMKNMI